MSTGKIIACLGIGLLAVIVLVVTDSQVSHRTDIAFYENEMKDRFAFDPDVQPQCDGMFKARAICIPFLAKF